MSSQKYFMYLNVQIAYYMLVFMGKILFVLDLFQILQNWNECSQSNILL